MRFAISLAIFALATATTAVAQSPAPIASQHAASGLAQTPPMGWNSWNHFADRVTQQDVREAADALVSSGMRDAGYVYVNVDDGWQGQRDAKGVLHANAKFPDMKALAGYVHSKGLKLGIYSSPGPKTCAGYAGSMGYEKKDANLYAAWGVDYLKYDLCSYSQILQEQASNDKTAQMRLMIAAYARMNLALKATGRAIVYSLCQYGDDAVWKWGSAVGGNLWRTTGDINPSWNRIYEIIEQQADLAQYAGPGHWNDPDMLEVGNGQLTQAENRSHFSMWAMLAAPLIAGNDIARMKPEIRQVLLNRDVIAIDQDPLGRQARRVYIDGKLEVWTRHLADGAIALAIFNAGDNRDASNPFHLDLTKLDLHGIQNGKDLWTGKLVKLTNNEPIELARHDILLVRIPAPRQNRGVADSPRDKEQ